MEMRNICSTGQRHRQSHPFHTLTAQTKEPGAEIRGAHHDLKQVFLGKLLPLFAVCGGREVEGGGGGRGGKKKYESARRLLENSPN